jgi:hypothetical protein
VCPPFVEGFQNGKDAAVYDELVDQEFGESG